MSQKRKTKNNSKADAVFKLLAFVYVVISIIFYIAVIKMDLLPGIYVTIFTMAVGVLTVAMVVGLIKKHKTRKLNIFCLIMIIIISAVYIYVTRYAMATMDFLNSALVEEKETEEYYIVVRSSSIYSSVDDLKEKEVYEFQLEDAVKQEATSKANITIKETENLVQMGQDLLDHQIEAILVGSTQYEMLSDEIKDFGTKTKILYTLNYEIEAEKPVEDKSSKHTIENGVFNIYISGIDTSGKISKVSRSDANIIATVNTNTHEILLTSIPRDYYVTLHSKKAKDKLTHSGIYGVNETITTVEDLLNIDINYYIRVNFTTVIKAVDTLGGVSVYSDYNFTAQGYSFKKGYNNVNGAQALAFSRERYSFAGGDNQRVKNQQHVIEAIIKKVTNSSTILTKYTDILASLQNSFQTNIDQKDISKLVKGQLENMKGWTVTSNALTGTGASKSTYSMGSQKLYVMIPNETSVKNATEKIQAILEK